MCEEYHHYQHQSNHLNPSDHCDTGCPRQRPNFCVEPYSPWNKAQRTIPFVPIPAIHRSTQPIQSHTTYQTAFYPRMLQVTPSYGPSRAPSKSSGEMEHESMYRSQFRWNCADVDRVIHKPPPFIQPTQPMKLSTTYFNDYPPKQGNPAVSAKRRPQWDMNPPKFDDLTTYRMQFAFHGAEAMNRPKVVKQEWMAECHPFNGLTIYKQDYQPTHLCPTSSVKPSIRKYKKSGDFDDRTTYKCAYEPFYYENEEDCIPCPLEKAVFPPRNKCEDVTVFPEVCRDLGDPQPPVPPCTAKETTVCPSHFQVRCCPQTIPCTSPYKLKSSRDSFGKTTIEVNPNTFGEMRAGGPVEVDCPPGNELPYLQYTPPPKISAMYRKPPTPKWSSANAARATGAANAGK